MKPRLTHHTSSAPSKARLYLERSWHQAQFFPAVLSRRTISTSSSVPREEIALGTQVRKAWNRWLSLKEESHQQAFVLPALISAMVALIIIILAVGEVIDANFSLVNTNNNSQKAFNIAEAGLNYYLWHLSPWPRRLQRWQDHSDYTRPKTWFWTLCP